MWRMMWRGSSCSLTRLRFSSTLSQMHKAKMRLVDRGHPIMIHTTFETRTIEALQSID